MSEGVNTKIIINLNIIMVSRLLDQYTYLHFAVGIIVYFWGLSFTSWFIIHSLYEYIEIDVNIYFLSYYMSIFRFIYIYMYVYINISLKIG